MLAVHLIKYYSKSTTTTSYLKRDHIQGIFQLNNHIKLLLSTVNRMNIKRLMRNRTVRKGFLLYKKRIFDFTTKFCNIFHFIFQYFDSACLISYIIASDILLLLQNFNFLAKVDRANYLIMCI